MTIIGIHDTLAETIGRMKISNPNEPSLEDLVKIRGGLYRAESTEMNLKKIRALESQIERHKAEKEAAKTKA